MLAVLATTRTITMTNADTDANQDSANEAKAAPARAKRASKAKSAKKAAKPRSKAKKARTPAAAPAKAKSREGTKQAELIGLLKRAKGASIAEMAEALGWQAHTVRGAMAGALKKKLGLTIESEKDEKRGRIYRIIA